MLQTQVKPQPQKAYESYYPPFTIPPDNAEIIGIYGTYRHPDGIKRQPVKVLFSYLAYGNFSKPPVKTVMVQGLHPNALAFSIDRDNLCNVTVFAIVTLGGK